VKRANESRTLPTRSAVLSRLEDLVAGRQTREEAAKWAAEWVNDTDDVKVDDFAVWEALTAILGADLISTD